jgi:hypothetical protein
MRRLPCCVFLMATTTAAATTLALADQGTVHDRIAASGGNPVRIVLGTDSPLLPLTELVSESDLIVRGRLVKLKSYLTADGHNIFTDYRLVPTQVYVDRSGMLTLGPKPGNPAPLTVTFLGGELDVEGTRVTFIVTATKQWREGESVHISA